MGEKWENILNGQELVASSAGQESVVEKCGSEQNKFIFIVNMINSGLWIILEK